MTISKRRFLNTSASIIGGVGIISATIPFVKSLMPSVKTRVAGASVAVDISSLVQGEQMTVQWRGKPVWILRRSGTMLSALTKNLRFLRDPDSNINSQQPQYAKNPMRSIKPEYFICFGLCTHLGCVPSFRPEVAPPDLGRDWQGGYFCPCHGSRFDLAGRVYKGVPAPTNLIVPPHKFIGEFKLLIGEDGGD